MDIPRFGDAIPFRAISHAVLAWHEPQVCYLLTWMSNPPKYALSTKTWDLPPIGISRETISAYIYCQIDKNPYIIVRQSGANTYE